MSKNSKCVKSICPCKKKTRSSKKNYYSAKEKVKKYSKNIIFIFVMNRLLFFFWNFRFNQSKNTLQALGVLKMIKLKSTPIFTSLRLSIPKFKASLKMLKSTRKGFKNKSTIKKNQPMIRLKKSKI